MIGKVISVSGVGRLRYRVQPGKIDVSERDGEFQSVGESIDNVCEINNRRVPAGTVVEMFEEADVVLFRDPNGPH